MLRFVALKRRLTGDACSVPDAPFQQAFAQFVLASTGNRNAIEPAADACGAPLRQEPVDPVLMSYAGKPMRAAVKAATG